MIRLDFINGTALKLYQNTNHFRMTSDSVILTRFMHVRKQDRILDVGTNNGVLLLVAGTQSHQSSVGIDINPDAIALAVKNAQVNQLGHLEFLTVALQDFDAPKFDQILCNPPYHDHRQHASDDKANFDLTLSLEDLAKHSCRLLKDKGRLAIIVKAQRLHEAFYTFEKHHLCVKRMQSIHHSLKHDASSICLEMVKNGHFETRIEAPYFHSDKE